MFGSRVAVKDAIDIAGEVTTAGCAAVRDRARPAVVDAACVAAIRAGGGRIVGKATLTELCLDAYGINDTFGTPINPCAPDRVPGGSSSGSAVAVALDQADVALGTDTGGSVRIPAACCGVAGLKTTWGRVPTAGVWPLAPGLDTVGPIARTVSGLAAGMRLLEPGFTLSGPAAVVDPAAVIGRLRVDGVHAGVEAAVDAALDGAGLRVREIRLPGWEATWPVFDAILLGEFWSAHRALLDAVGVGDRANRALRAGRAVTASRLAEARSGQAAWRAEILRVLCDVDLIALPTLVDEPPTRAGVGRYPITALTAPFNLAGVPALAMPVPGPGSVPPSLQLVGGPGAEERLIATALLVECGSVGGGRSS